MSKLSVAPFIKEFYPEYYSWNEYPAAQCAPFCKIDNKWGFFSNFARTPITVNDVVFKNVEQLYQLMKFRDSKAVLAVYKAGNPKMTGKHWDGICRREDWGQMLIDALKFCLMQKYEQSEAFRNELRASEGLFIVEDQTTFTKKTPDTWGVKLHDGIFEGSNLMGRLLMELRDNGKLGYHLPDDALDFIEIMK